MDIKLAVYAFDLCPNLKEMIIPDGRTHDMSVHV